MDDKISSHRHIQKLTTNWIYHTKVSRPSYWRCLVRPKNKRVMLKMTSVLFDTASFLNNLVIVRLRLEVRVFKCRICWRASSWNRNSKHLISLIFVLSTWRKPCFCTCSSMISLDLIEKSSRLTTRPKLSRQSFYDKSIPFQSKTILEL